MEKISINKTFAVESLKNLEETVSAGINTPATANWYTILPISFCNILRFKRDLDDIEALSNMSDSIKVNMFSNPIGTLIFPSSILQHFNFSSLSSNNAKIIVSMIKKQDVDIADKKYSIRQTPVLTYNIREIFHIKKLVEDLKQIESSESDEHIVEFDNYAIGEFLSASLYKFSNNK